MSDKHQGQSLSGLCTALPTENPGGSDFLGKLKKAKNGSSACGKPWRVADGGQKKSPNLD